MKEYPKSSDTKRGLAPCAKYHIILFQEEGIWHKVQKYWWTHAG